VAVGLATVPLQHHWVDLPRHHHHREARAPGPRSGGNPTIGAVAAPGATHRAPRPAAAPAAQDAVLLSSLERRCGVPVAELRTLADSAVLYEQVHATRDTRLHVLTVLARSDRAGCLRRLKLYAEDRVGCEPGKGEMPWMGCDFDLTLAREAAARR
jgi:hypothetical protein